MGKVRGIKRIKTKAVKVNSLHFQVCPIAHNPDIWNGSLSGDILNSPHVDFIRLRIKVGRKEAMNRLYDTRYSYMYEYWDEVQYGLGGRTKKYIAKKANSLLDLFDRISDKGFDKKSRIQILKEPLWRTRGFDGGENLKGLEIFHGHHRASCLCALEIDMVNVDLCKDSMPGSKHWGQKLSRMKGVNL